MPDNIEGGSHMGESALEQVSELSYLFKDLINNIGAAIYLAQDRKFIFVNPFFEFLSGYSTAELIGHNTLDFVHPDDRETVREKAIDALKESGSRAPSYEYRFIQKSGEIVWVIERISSIKYRGRNAVLGSFMVITRRKMLEEALRKSEDKYRNILQQMQEPYFERDLEGHYTFANDAMCAITGYPREELIGMHLSKLVPAEEREKLLNVLKYVLATGKPGKTHIFSIIRKDGSPRYVETSVALIRDDSGRPTGYSCVARDYTEQKQLFDALSESEERHRRMLDQLQDSYCEVDLKGNFTYVNSTMCDNLGFSREEMIGKNYVEFIPANEIEDMFKAFNQVYLTGVPNPRYQHTVIRRNGELIFTETSVDLARDKQGNAIGFRALARDVTERKKLEEKLVRSEERYRTILNEIEDAYYEVDLKGNFTFVNRACARDLRYSEEELIGINFGQVVPEDEASTVYNNFNQVYRTGEANHGFSHRIIRKDGTTGYVEANISPVRDRQGNIIGFRTISRDITERKKLEQKLVEMATHDYLTGLPNRVLLNDRFSVAVAHARRNGCKLAVISLDVDSLKTVNDTLGHSAGDDLLRMVATRLSYALRASDTVARIGGDEFVLLLLDIHDLSDAIIITEKIVDFFKDPFVIEGHSLNASASMGIAIYPDEGKDLDILMRKADAAMYHSKKAGGNCYKVFSDSDRQELKY